MIEYLKLEFKAKSFKPPYLFMGSAIRGAFGNALKKVVCVNPNCECRGCFALTSCIYYSFFEEKNSQHAYRVDIDLDIKNLQFSIYLFGDSIKHTIYVISAILHVAKDLGIGAKRDKFELETISVNDKFIYKNDEFLKFDIEPIRFYLESYSPKIKLHFLTPLRVKMCNRFLRDDISIVSIFRSLNSKIEELDKEHKKVFVSWDAKIISKNIRFLDLSRFSNRQNKKMLLGGIVGDIDIDGLSQKEYEILKVGEMLGVGKSTVFGLGKIMVENR